MEIILSGKEKRTSNKNMNLNKTKLDKAFEAVGFEPLHGLLYDAEMIANDYGESLKSAEMIPLLTCGGKICYPSRATADKVRKKRMRNGSKKLRSYHCGECKGFHLTSSFQENKPNQK
jgi:hypothetical protein